MKLNEKIAITCVLSGVVFSTIDYIQVIKTEREKRRKIESNMDRDLLAITAAQMRLEERISSGEFKPRNVQEVISELDFQTMIERLKF